jgi:hypothetical protein
MNIALGLHVGVMTCIRKCSNKAWFREGQNSSTHPRSIIYVTSKRYSHIHTDLHSEIRLHCHTLNIMRIWLLPWANGRHGYCTNSPSETLPMSGDFYWINFSIELALYSDLMKFPIENKFWENSNKSS